MSDTRSTDQRRILLVEEDAGIREAVIMALEAEAYQTTAARSPDEAVTLIRDNTYHLVLASPFASLPKGALDSLRPIREHAFPTPVGVLSSWSIAPEDAERLGFAFLMSKPFDLDDFISHVAMAINMPLTTEQRAQAHTVHAYFACLTAREWDGLVALCAEDVVYVLPGSNVYAGVVEGRERFRDYSARTFADFPDTEFGDIHIYSTPNGLAARYKASWRQPDGSHASMTGAVILHFQGRLIQRVGVCLDERHLRALTET